MKIKDKKSLDYRKEDRSLEKFHDDMKWNSEREKIWSEIVRDEMIFKTGKKITVDNYGCGQDGEVIFDADKVTLDPDKKFIIDGHEKLIEIKAYNRPIDPEDVITIKVSALKKCIEKEAFILIPALQRWVLIPPACCEYMLEKGDPQIYPRFSPKDLAIQFKTMEISIIRNNGGLRMYEWKNPESLKMIRNSWDRLFLKEM